jgi:hypothetical protein
MKTDRMQRRETAMRYWAFRTAWASLKSLDSPVRFATAIVLSAQPITTEAMLRWEAAKIAMHRARHGIRDPRASNRAALAALMSVVPVKLRAWELDRLTDCVGQESDE